MPESANPFAVMLVLFVGAAIVRSLLFVGEPFRVIDHFALVATEAGRLKDELRSRLSADPLPSEARQAGRSLALLEWEEGKTRDANILLSRVWSADWNASDGSTREYPLDAMTVGETHLVLGGFQGASECFWRTLDYDMRVAGPSNQIVARDLNNLGVVCYLAATTRPNRAERIVALKSAERLFVRADEMLSSYGASTFATRAYVAYNQALAARDSGNDQDSVQLTESANHRLALGQRWGAGSWPGP